MVDLSLPLASTDFLTGKALGTFTGASLATVVSGNTARYLLKRDVRIVPFVLAVVFAYVAAQITGDPDDVGDYALVLLNGSLLFCTAIGANQVLVSAVQQQAGDGIKPFGAPKRQVRWLQSWYPDEPPR